MTSLTKKRDRLLALIESYGSCAVAFSAGVDSTVVAKAAQLALGNKAVAVTADSPSLAEGELAHALIKPGYFDPAGFGILTGDEQLGEHLNRIGQGTAVIAAVQIRLG